MSLDLGTLTGYLALDDSQMAGVLGGLPDRMTGSAAGLTAAAAGVSALVAAAFVNGFQDAMQAESLDASLAAALDLDPETSARAGEVAGNLYVQAYGESIEDVYAATEAVMSSIPGMMNAPQAELEATTAAVMDLASAFEIDTARAAQVVGGMLSGGLVADAQEGADLVAAALQQVPVAVREDVLDAMSEYGPYFGQLGMSGSEAMAGLVAASADGTIAIDKYGDALKELTIRSTDMSATSVAAYEAAGLNAEDMSARMLAGGETAAGAMDEIVAGLMSIQDPTEQANAAIALFGTPLEDLGTGAVPEFLTGLSSMGEGMGDVSGSAADLGSTLGGTTTASLESVQRQFGMVWQDLATNFLPIVSEVAAWAAENPELMTAVAAGLGILAVGLGVAAAAQWAMNAAWLASPITWVILAIVALIAAFVWLAMNAEEVNAWVQGVWDGFVGWLTETIEGLAAWWNEVWAGFASWITEVWNGFIGWIQEVWNGFVSWLQESGAAIATWWNELWAGIGAWVAEVWNGFVAWIMEIFIGYVSWLYGIGSGISSWWNGLWQGIGDWVAATWNGFIAWIQAIFTGYVSWLYGIGSGIVSWWNGLWSGIGAFVSSTWNAFIAGIVAIFNGFVGTVRGIGGQISSWWSGLWSGVRSGAESAWNGIIGWLGGIGGMILGAFSGAGSWLRDIGRNVLDGLMGGLQSGWNAVVSWINGLGGGIIDTFASILGIHSPSLVFREFGVNTIQGYLLGLDDMQAEVDARVANIASVPTTEEIRNAAMGEQLAADAGSSRTRDDRGRTIIVEGNVGWMPDELAEEIEKREDRATALADLDEFVGIA